MYPFLFATLLPSLLLFLTQYGTSLTMNCAKVSVYSLFLNSSSLSMIRLCFPNTLFFFSRLTPEKKNSDRCLSIGCLSTIMLRDSSHRGSILEHCQSNGRYSCS